MNPQLLEAAQAAMAALQAVEYGCQSDDLNWFCAECDRREGSGHMAECLVGIALAKLKLMLLGNENSEPTVWGPKLYDNQNHLY